MDYLNPHSLESLFLKAIKLMDSVLWDGITQGKFDIFEDFINQKIDDFAKIKYW